MTIIGDFAKGFIVVWCVAFISLIMEFIVIGQTILAGFMNLGFLLPSSIVIYGYLKNNKDKKTLSDNSEYKNFGKLGMGIAYHVCGDISLKTLLFFRVCLTAVLCAFGRAILWKVRIIRVRC